MVLLQTKITVEESSTTLYIRWQQHSNVPVKLLQPAHHIKLCLGLSKFYPPFYLCILPVGLQYVSEGNSSLCTYSIGREGTNCAQAII